MNKFNSIFGQILQYFRIRILSELYGKHEPRKA